MKEDDYELIDKVIHQRATTDEIARFGERMKDPEFETSYREISHIAGSVTIHEREKLRGLLREAQKSTGQSRSMYLPLAVAASVIFALAISYLLWLPSPTDRLFDRHYARYADLKLNKPRGTSDIYEMKLKAYQNYLEGEIDSAQYQLDQFAADAAEPDHEVITLTALCLMEEKSFDEAIKAFDRLDGLTAEQNHIKWYKALSHLGNGDTEEATRILERLLSDPEFSSQASALIEAL